MNAHTPMHDATPEDPSADNGALLRGRQVALLERLAEAGVRLAETIERRAADSDAPNDVAMAFSRVARAVRMTALLQSRLLKDMEEARSRAAFVSSRDQEQAAEDEARRDPAYGRKARVEAIVVRVAQAQGEDENKIDRIVQEAGERLDDDDIYGDVLTRPVGELVALICRDLGLDPDWGRLAEEAWAQEEIKSGAAGSPFLSSHLPPGGVLETACDLDGQAGREGDAGPKPNAQRTAHPHPRLFPHPRPFPHRRGREQALISS